MNRQHIIETIMEDAMATEECLITDDHLAFLRRTLEENIPVDIPDVFFQNFYEHCEMEWEDLADSMCNNRCPNCNKEIEPCSSKKFYA